jgi:dextranase
MTVGISMSKAQYRQGEAIHIFVEASQDADIKILIQHLAEPPYLFYDGMQLSRVGGYGVDATINGIEVSTSFDVVADWRDHIRYGFLSGFSKADKEDASDVEWLTKAHLNAVQFYDWMFRHESLLPPEPEYIDPLNRELSYPAVLSKIDGCLERGIAPMAYGAVYAASRSFWETHKDWGLYCQNGEPMSFGGWLQFMDISTGSPWSKHILGEFCTVAEKAGFLGIHMDTYGFPKNAYTAKGQPVSLAAEFPALVENGKNGLRSVNADTAVIFNCVGNWPVETVAKSPVDAVYIEVWPPYERYSHLVSLIRNALILGNQKSVILAAYMSPFKSAETFDEIIAAENALLLTYSIIHACGGKQLVFGENACVLCDPYYVNHKPLRPEFLPELHCYLDHTVRMSELLDARVVEDISAEFSGGINTEFQFSGAPCSPFPDAGTVWTSVGRTDDKYIFQLVNLIGLEHDLWDSPQRRPEPLENIHVEALVDSTIKGIYLASPNGNHGRPQSISFSTKQTPRGQVVCFTINTIVVWTTVWIEFET